VVRIRVRESNFFVCSSLLSSHPLHYPHAFPSRYFNTTCCSLFQLDGLDGQTCPHHPSCMIDDQWSTHFLSFLPFSPASPAFSPFREGKRAIAHTRQRDSLCLISMALPFTALTMAPGLTCARACHPRSFYLPRPILILRLWTPPFYMQTPPLCLLHCLFTQLGLGTAAP
jgi:hypothetical protein